MAAHAHAQDRVRRSNPLQAIKEINRKRGQIWESYLIESFKQTPWMQARALSGVEGADQMIVEYADLIDRLADLWRFPMLKLPARSENYEARTDALIKWVTATSYLRRLVVAAARRPRRPTPVMSAVL
jgi:hypothetical protein